VKTYKLFTKEECNIILKDILSNYKSQYVTRKFENDSSSYYKIEIIEKNWYFYKIKNWFENEVNLGETDGYLTLFFYKEGDRFPLHIDRIPNTTFYHDAIYNVNIMLNEEYGGGEFILENKSYKQPAGMVYYYESTKPHGVNIVTHGIRYTLIYFIRERDIRGIKKTFL